MFSSLFPVPPIIMPAPIRLLWFDNGIAGFGVVDFKSFYWACIYVGIENAGMTMVDTQVVVM